MILVAQKVTATNLLLRRLLARKEFNTENAQFRRVTQPPVLHINLRKRLPSSIGPPGSTLPYSVDAETDTSELQSEIASLADAKRLIETDLGRVQEVMMKSPTGSSDALHAMYAPIMEDPLPTLTRNGYVLDDSQISSGASGSLSPSEILASSSNRNPKEFRRQMRNKNLRPSVSERA
eukprot:GHVO01051149.1.p1 GENE.GHVO01051149.1~~GHVO01051149.1.p1  ORF type:complete len:178 (-),score=8.88 GHVO01051149.1:124-657(-)